MFTRKIALYLILATAALTGCSSLSDGPGTDGQGTATEIVTTAETSTSADTTAADTTAADTTSVDTTAADTTPSTQPAATMSEDEALVEQWAGKIYPGISISGVELGGLTYKEAEAIMAETLEKVLARKISFTAGPKSYSLSQKELGVSFSYADALKSAQEAYLDLSVAEKADTIRNQPQLAFSVSKSVDEDVLKALTEKVGDEINRKATREVSGRRLYTITFRDDLKERIDFKTEDAKSFEALLEITPKLTSQVTLGKGYSWFDEDNKNRSYNVKKAARRINGYVLDPGEVFSFNRVVGSPSKSNGYKLANVYTGDGMGEGYGGGVCQVSSTLYNAVVRAGLQLVERHTHAYSVLYLPYGMDATVYYPSLDLRFRNTLDYPITIKAYAEDGDLSFRINSDRNAMGGISYKFKSDVLWEGKSSWKVEYTSDLEPGESEIVYKPHPALEVNVYRSTYKDGKFVKRILFDNVTYRSMKGLKLVGKE